MAPGPKPLNVGPGWRSLVRLMAPTEERSDILADLEEEAAQVEAAKGRRAAARWVRWQVLHSLPPWIVRRGREAGLRGVASLLMLHRGLGSDIRVATRRLLHARAYSALAVVTLAIGIGAVSAVFSLAYGLWLKPLPYHEPDRLVWVHGRHEPSGSMGSLTAAEFAELRRGSRSFSGVAGFVYGARILRLRDEPVRVTAHHVSAELFQVLGVRPVLGRDLLPADAERGTHRVMLSHAAWTRYFQRDTAAIGRTFTLDGLGHQIVGVMPPGFSFPRGLESDVWIPVRDLGREGNPAARLVQVIARLTPGRTVADAGAEVAGLAPQVSDATSAAGRWTTVVVPADTTISMTGRRAFEALLGIVALFLLIACANLAGLVLARNAVRRPELALCLSLGASRVRLARMLLIESTLLALIGCVAGVLVSAYASRALAAVMPPRMPGVGDVAVNGLVVAVAVGAALVCAALVGMVPALSLRSTRPAEALSGARVIGGRTARGQRALVIVEVVLAVVLVVSASVMLRAFVGLLDRDRGYDPRGVLSLNVSFPFDDDSYLPVERRARGFEDIRERVAAVPGVHDVAMTTGFPGSALGVLEAVPITPAQGAGQLIAAVHACTPGYFATLRTPITAGRPFATTDSAGAPPVAIVNERLARQFPGANPIGQRIPLEIQGEKATYEIVGVAGDIGLSDNPGNRIFVPLAQASPYWVDVVVRGDGSDGLAPRVREAVRRLSPDLLIENESSFQRIIANSVALQRTQSVFAALIGALSMLVAGIGLYGLMTFLATQRRREFGIRLALGSQPRRLFRDTLVAALRLVVVGLILGTAASVLLVRLLSTRVFGLASTDLTAYAAGAVVVLLVSLAAAWIPARRVMQTDPLIALRSE